MYCKKEWNHFRSFFLIQDQEIYYFDTKKHGFIWIQYGHKKREKNTNKCRIWCNCFYKSIHYNNIYIYRELWLRKNKCIFKLMIFSEEKHSESIIKWLYHLLGKDWLSYFNMIQKNNKYSIEKWFQIKRADIYTLFLYIYSNQQHILWIFIL